jgi:hypothetical protein
MGHLVLCSGTACCGGGECMECSGQGLLVCKVGGGYLVLYEGVKNFVGKDSVVVIQMVSGCVFLVNVKCLSHERFYMSMRNCLRTLFIIPLCLCI